jgi:hypothetical protein
MGSGDEADPLHLARGSSRRQRRPTLTRRLGLSSVTSRASSGEKNGTSGLPTFPYCSLTDPIASRDGERSNSRVTMGSVCSSSYGRKFELNRPLFIGVLVPNRWRQGLQHFPSLHRTLSCEDSEEIKKGIK